MNKIQVMSVLLLGTTSFVSAMAPKQLTGASFSQAGKKFTAEWVKEPKQLTAASFTEEGKKFAVEWIKIRGDVSYRSSNHKATWNDRLAHLGIEKCLGGKALELAGDLFPLLKTDETLFVEYNNLKQMSLAGKTLRNSLVIYLMNKHYSVMGNSEVDFWRAECTKLILNTLLWQEQHEQQ